jgi:hypothetical protein
MLSHRDAAYREQRALFRRKERERERERDRERGNASSKRWATAHSTQHSA